MVRAVVDVWQTAVETTGGDLMGGDVVEVMAFGDEVILGGGSGKAVVVVCVEMVVLTTAETIDVPTIVDTAGVTSAVWVEVWCLESLEDDLETCFSGST
ncbi:hypothetical protein HanRHA438_Chr16g0763271 [Helianthus annuus]|nr:hypothetical protein HanRHA438_Chr16g0763271 [Helianthus annuus]